MIRVIVYRKYMTVFSNRLSRWCLMMGCLISVAACQEIFSSHDLEKTAAAINKKCPVMLDDETQFDGVQTGKNSLTYNFTLVNALASATDTHAFRLAMWPGILSNLRVSK